MSTARRVGCRVRPSNTECDEGKKRKKKARKQIGAWQSERTAEGTRSERKRKGKNKSDVRNKSFIHWERDAAAAAAAGFAAAPADCMIEY